MRFGPTDTIHLSANEIIKTIGMSKSTFYRYKEELLSDGLLSMNDGEISINSQYFPVFKSYPKEITAFKEQIEQYAAEDPSYKESRVYKEFKKLEKNGFKDIKIPLYKLPEYLESGAFFIKRGDKPVQQSSYPFL